MKRLLLFFGVLFLSMACVFFGQQATPTALKPVATTAIPPTPVVKTPTLAPLTNCQTSFSHIELKEPYQRQVGNEPRYTFSTIELANLYHETSLQSICIPPELGAPFLNVDWNTKNLASKGRMVSIGFQGLYDGTGWGDTFLLYSTYDFRGGTEHDQFASPDDWTAFQSGSITDVQPLSNASGFSRIKIGVSMGKVPVFKTYIYPIEKGYLALVYKLGLYDDDYEARAEDFRHGQYPADQIRMVNLFDRIALTVQVK